MDKKHNAAKIIRNKCNSFLKSKPHNTPPHKTKAHFTPKDIANEIIKTITSTKEIRNVGIDHRLNQIHTSTQRKPLTRPCKKQKQIAIIRNIVSDIRKVLPQLTARTILEEIKHTCMSNEWWHITNHTILKEKINQKRYNRRGNDYLYNLWAHIHKGEKEKKKKEKIK